MREVSSLEDLRRLLGSERPYPFNGILLATRQDEQYEYFLRFWTELDRQTGQGCRLFVLRDRADHLGVAEMSFAFLMTINMLTWVTPKSGSAAAYEIARDLGVDQRNMPCIAVFEGIPREDQEVVLIRLPPKDKLTEYMRSVLDQMNRLALKPAPERMAALKRRLGARRALRVTRASLADIIERTFGSRLARLVDPD